MLHNIKGSLLASFFLLLSSISFASAHEVSELELDALGKKIYNYPTWPALLHSIDGVSSIKDPAFILSSSNFTLKNELVATIRHLESSAESSCQFPARRQFILSALNLKQNVIPKPVCTEYLTFKAKAPADEIDLIYATENISQPSSMMGHIMLKISGINDSNISVEHGVSYFTELNSFNVPLIIWESLITGKDGYFQVSPFREIFNYYLKTEQRNVWEYKINLSREQSELFHNHLWELKETKLKYFFNTYNCATFTQMLLRVARPDKVTLSDDWLSPIDIVKSTTKAGIISSSTLTPSDKWQLRMLSNTVDDGAIKKIKNIIDSKEKPEFDISSPEKAYLSSLLAKTYNEYNLSEGKYEREKWLSIDTKIDQLIPVKENEYTLDVSQFKSPLKTPGDSQVSIGYTYLDQRKWVNFKYLPASHSIEDDNRQFFNENELKLMEFSILSNATSGELKLNSWTLYSAKSYIPWNQFTGGTSGHFTISAEQHWGDSLLPSLAGTLNGGLGYTYALTKDLSIFSMLNIGLGGSSNGGYLYAEPEVGLYFYQVFDMKSFLSYKNIYNQKRSRYKQHLLSIKHSILDLSEWSVILEYEERWNTLKSNTQYSAHLKYQY